LTGTCRLNDRHISCSPLFVNYVCMPEKDQQVLMATEDFASKHGLCIEVCDVVTFTGRLKAFLKGVKTTPATLIRNSRFEGDLAQEALQSKLDCCLNQ
jgi:hypothetical protein